MQLEKLPGIARVVAMIGICATVWLFGATRAQAAPVAIVAAENFYGDIAQQIGGADVKVTSILSNPDQDPHLFETSASVARSISAARVVILNGIDYDPWMEKLVAAAKGNGRKSIVVADLLGRKKGENPHIWYDPATMLALAKTLAEELAIADPAHATDFGQRLTTFQNSMKPLQDRIAVMRTRAQDLSVTATEPVFGYMFAALGMKVRNESFQLSVMNDTEPSASDVAAFETDLKTRRVKLLVYNSQASNPTAARMEKLARKSGIPVVGATETEPAGKRYQAWILGELDAIDRALPK